MNLEEIAPIIEEIIKEAIAEKVYPFGFGKYKGLSNKIASHTLINSVQVEVKGGQKNITRRQFLKGQTGNNSKQSLQVIMVDYAQYVQAGRRPGKAGVPIKSLLEWIKDRKLKGRNKKGQFISNESFAFAIQTNIKKFGIRPAPFLDVALDKLFDDPRITDLLGDAAYEDLINALEGI